MNPESAGIRNRVPVVRVFEYLIYASALLCIVYAAVFIRPNLVGPWESYHLYNTYSETTAPEVVMSIQKGANIAGHYGNHNYGIINASGFLLRKLQVNLTLFNVRIVSLIAGFISLFFFFRICARWYGTKSAIFATLLLAINETFLTFEHFLLPQTITFAATLFALDQFQQLSERPRSRKILTPILLGLAYALCAINYLLGRLFLVLIIAYQIKMIFTGKKLLQIQRHTIKSNLIKFLITLGSFLLFLQLFNPGNVSFLFSRAFLFSDLGEYATNSASFINNFSYNLPFILKYFLWGAPFEKESLAFFILQDAKYPLISLPVFLLFIGAFILAIRKFQNFKNTFPLFIFGALTTILCMSYVYNTFPDGSRTTTLSSFRVFYLLLPVYLMIAGLHRVAFRKMRAVFAKAAPLVSLGLIFTPLFALGFNTYSRNQARFEKFYESHEFNFAESAPRKEFSNEELEKATGMRERLIRTQEGIYFINQIYLRKLAEKIDSRFSAASKQSGGKFIINLPERKYTPSYYSLCCSLSEKPYMKFFLSLYLSDLGIPNSYVVSNGSFRFDKAQLYISTSAAEHSVIMNKYPGAKSIALN